MDMLYRQPVLNHDPEGFKKLKKIHTELPESLLKSQLQDLRLGSAHKNVLILKNSKIKCHACRDLLYMQPEPKTKKDAAGSQYNT